MLPPDDNSQAAPQAAQRLPSGRWPKGVSGNPDRHRQFVERQRQRQAPEKELLADIVARAGRPLSAVDMAFARLAATELAKAHELDLYLAGKAADK